MKKNYTIPFRSAYSSPVRYSFDSPNPSMTEKHHAAACDINHLLATYRKTGLCTHVNTHQGDYSDISNVPTYHEAMQQIQAADNAFKTLTAEIRAQFSNDPAQFLNFVNDPNNREEMGKMGLLKPNAQCAPIQPAPESIETSSDAS